MTKYIYLVLPVIAVLAFVQCETPESPDFTLSNKVDSPLIAESTFKFLGAKNALIDTTNEDLRNLFEIDGENFITISQEENFNFGDLDGAVPDVDVEPTSFESAVGEIRLTDFSSHVDNGNLGEASFEELTGQPSTIQQGDPIPGAQSPFPVNIELETDFFVSATIKRGELLISLKNDLGFDIDELDLELFSDNHSLGDIHISNFNHTEVRTETLLLVDNPEIDPEVELKDLNANIEISWSGQTMQDDAGRLIIIDLTGQELYATAVNAIIPSQEFNSSGSTAFSDEEFLFNEPGHYIELSSGTLAVQNIINSIDVDIEILEISFPGLRLPPYGIADSLTIRFEGENKIPRNNSQPVSNSYDLTDVRIYAEDNQITYNISSLTEDTQASEGSDSRIIHETDQIYAEVLLSDLIIAEAFGIISNRQVLLNTDIAADGSGVDIMNDLEAELIVIDGIDDLSKKIEGLEFTMASLSINYETNVGVPTTIIGAFLGVDANGNEFFLKGEPGTDNEVTTDDPTHQLRKNGSAIHPSNLIKFKIEPNQTPADILTNTFDRSNSSITDFLNRLPTTIRFIGTADINSENIEGLIHNPVVFNPAIAMNIPLALRADGATFTDTTAVSLADLPGPGDNALLEEGSLTIRYTNSIPLGINLELEFLTSEGDLITAVPLIDESAIEFLPAQVNAGGFSMAPAEDYTIISLNRSQLDALNQTRNVRLIAGLNTTASEEIRIRTIDDVGVSVSGKFVIRNKID